MDEIEDFDQKEKEDFEDEYEALNDIMQSIWTSTIYQCIIVLKVSMELTINVLKLYKE